MNKMKIIGRIEEQERLKNLYDSGNAEFVAIYGRRRVGKTFLVRQMFDKEILFDLTGLAKGNTREQLKNFNTSLRRASNSKIKIADTWLNAFDQLRDCVEKSNKKRKILFIDEIPWLDTPRSGFLTALEHFWNGWAAWQNDIMLIVCGSATSWITNKLINNHGGLHNRLTANIFLAPFTLAETEQYIKYRNLKYTQYQIAECYMVMGGIPYYLNQFEQGLSIAQNIDKTFFSKKSELRNEFQNLYASLFKNSEDYIKVVGALSQKMQGLRRSEILKLTKLKSGEGVTTVLKNLESCGFIRTYTSPSKKERDILYQLLDAYTLFYFKYLKKARSNDERFWTNSINTPTHNSWAGYAFEILALQHISEIKNALGISGVQTSVYAWRSERSDPAVQIDLVLDRKDGMYNICEMKFSDRQYAITKNYEENLRQKIASFREENMNNNAINLVMITTYGLKKNKYTGVAQREITLEDLFKNAV
jgi:hypothetical protein